MSNKQNLENIKKLREITGVGFKDCKLAIDENNGDINKSIEYLRKKGIAKASKKMSRIAADGLVLIYEKNGMISAIEINSETDFVAKNKEFITFCKEISEINFKTRGDIKKIKSSIMKNKKTAEETLIALISKIGEKITLRRSKFFDNKGTNFSYVHNSLEKNIGKVVSVVKLEKNEKIDLKEIGSKLAMHIAASSPIAIDENEIGRDILNKELEIIREEVKNSGKKGEMIEKIANGKLKKFVSDNTLLNQIWIMDTKKKVKEVLKSCSGEEEIKVLDFVRFKVGEGV
ncbi:MAG: translation elongation factor Ts [Pelagibacteraceae bacterium]|jgi:elongation factor Ts|nr:translation elongation factor Ts [Pelagibacteraceae bacterium]MBO6483520.1 translation elongation factor Ts [Pelagibacteraceae bacterium]MBO6485216.1 translation elongation factor Ts [Pelagibacteraceae bacterium]MBO6487151.1 translation elongation factor Ts [Pelagibacteraceae bacterium]